MTRTNSTIFWKGVKENVSLKTDGSDPFQWRRIVFELDIPPPNTMVAYSKYIKSSTAQVLGGVPPDTGNNLTGVYSYFRAAESLLDPENVALQDAMYKGTRGVDWFDPMLARPDSSVYTVMYDRTVTVNSGNDAGVMKNYSHWHGFNKSCTYEEGEFGAVNNPAELPSVSKPGLKNVFIWDQFSTLTAGTLAIEMNIVARRYWHEK